ncbi:helix-turn-helix transcriptional regulator [Embleya sp. NBC_00888]|uniref:helix-turn-helix transcriptional regulator n=1 Tax=Embleya sp. NBC_00888 TaxID=2975960 RepID=UPI0038660E68|nr:helix-turn-helix transcriptional regulator [Embleya sp. NBC_00888]
MNGVNRTERTDDIENRTSGGVDGVGETRRALGGFLRARRERISPENVGLVGGGRRRVRGLRREELAQLAGISVDYYVRLEQGRATQPSPEVLDALARALGLDAAERRHLTTLTAARREPAPATRVSPLLQQVLDSMARLPAFVTNHRLDVVAWNDLGAELVGGLADPGRRDPNNARYFFLDPGSRVVFPEWEERAGDAVGQLRVAAGLYPGDPELAELITELSAHSADFRRIWATGKVLMCSAGRKQVRHPRVGLMHLDYETLRVPVPSGETGLEIHIFCAPEHSPDARALAELATITASASASAEDATPTTEALSPSIG